MALGSSAVVANIVVRMTNLASREFDNLARDYDIAAARMMGTTAKIDASFSAMGSFATRLGVAGAAVTAFAAVSDQGFESAKQRLVSYADVNKQMADQIGRNALNMAGQVGISATKIVEAYYPLMTAGIRGAQANTIISQSAKIAAASNSNLEDVVKAVSAVMNEYRIKGVAPTLGAMDEMNKMVQLGQLKWKDMAAGIGTAIPIAANTGVSFDQVGAILVQLTKRGISFRQAAQDVNSTMRAFQVIQRNAIIGSNGLGLAWQKLYNSSGKNAIVTMMALQAAAQHATVNTKELGNETGFTGQRLFTLQQRLENYGNRLYTLAQGQTSMNVIMRTTGKNGDALIQTLNKLDAANGSINQSFAGWTSNASSGVKRLKESFNAMFIEIGAAILPSLSAIAAHMVPITMMIATLATKFPTLTGVVLLGSTALLAFGLTMKGLHIVIQTTEQGITAFNRVLTLLGLAEQQEQKLTEAQMLTRAKASTQEDLYQAAMLKRYLTEKMAAAETANDTKQLAVLQGWMDRTTAAEKALAKADIDAATAEKLVTNARREGIAAMVAGKTAVEDEVHYAGLAEVATQARTTAIDDLKDAIARAVPLQTAYKEAVVGQQEAETAMSDMLSIHATKLGQLDMRYTASKNAVKELQAATEAATKSDQELAAVNDVINSKMELVNATSKIQAEMSGKVKDAQDVQITSAVGVQVAMDAELAAKEANVVADGELVVAETGLAAVLTGALTPAVGVATAAFAAMGTVIDVLLGWVGLIVLAIAAVGFAAYKLYQNFEPFRQLVQLYFLPLEVEFKALVFAIELVTYALEDLFGWLGHTIDTMMQGWNTAVEGSNKSTGLLAKALQWLKGILQDLVVWFQKVLDKMGPLAKAFYVVADAAAAFGGALGWVGDHLGKVIKTLQNYIAQHQKVVDVTKKSGETIKTTSASVAQAMMQMQLSQIAFAKSMAQTAQQADNMMKAYKKSIADLEPQTDHTADAMRNSFIDKTRSAYTTIVDMTHQMRKQVADILTNTPVVIPVALTQPKLSYQAQKITPSKDVGAALADANNGALSENLKKMADLMQTLPARFQQAGNQVVAGYKAQVMAEYKTYIQGINSEDQRHASALTTIEANNRAKLHEIYDSFEQRHKALYDSYLARVKQLQDSYYAKLTTFLQQYQTAIETAGQSYTASMNAIQARITQDQANHRQALLLLQQKEQTAIKDHEGRAQTAQRALIVEQYKYLLDAEKRRYDNEIILLTREAQQLSASFQTHQKQREALATAHLNGMQTAFQKGNASLNSTFQRATTAQQAAYLLQQQRANDSANRQLAAEAARHTKYLDSLKAAFDKHVAGIEAALKKQGTSAAARGFTAVQNQAQADADNAMKALDFAVLTHAKNISQYEATAKKAEENLTAVNKAVAKALNLVKLPADSLAAKLKALTDASDKRLARAEVRYEWDMAHGGATIADIEALKAAAKANAAYTNAVTKAQNIVNLYGLSTSKTKKANDEFTAALNKMSNQASNEMSKAMSKLAIDLIDGGTASAMALGLLQRAVQDQTRLDIANQKATEKQTQAQIKTDIASGALADAFDKTKNLLGTRVTNATNAASEEFLKFGDITAATSAKMAVLATKQEQQTLAEAAAARAWTEAQITAAKSAGDLTTAFNLTKQQTQSDLTNALAQAAGEILQFGQVTQATADKITALETATYQQAVADKKASDIANAAFLKAALAAGDAATAFETIKSTVDTNVTTALDGLSGYFLTGAGNLNDLLTTYKAAKAAQDADTVATIRANNAVGNFTDALSAVTSKINGDVQNALDGLTEYFLTGQGDFKQLLQSYQQAKVAQDKLTAAQWDATFSVADAATQASMLAQRFQYMVDAQKNATQNDDTMATDQQAVADAAAALVVHAIDAQTTAITDQTDIMKSVSAIISAQSALAVQKIDDTNSILDAQSASLVSLVTANGDIAVDIIKGDAVKLAEDRVLAAAQQKVNQDAVNIARVQAQADMAANRSALKVATDQLTQSRIKQSVDAQAAASQRQADLDALAVANDQLTVAKAQAKVDADQLVVQTDIATALGAVRDYQSMLNTDLKSLTSAQDQLRADQTKLANDKDIADQLAALGAQQEAQAEQQTESDTAAGQQQAEQYALEMANLKAKQSADQRNQSLLQAQITAINNVRDALNQTQAAQLAELQSLVAAQTKLITLGALGIARGSVNQTDYTSYLRNWAGDSHTNPSVPTS